MKPRVFIGSSSEAGEERNWLQVQLYRKGVLAEPWDQSIFEPSRSAWESLVDTVNKCDFGIFILTPDDEVDSTSGKSRRPRDNVILELGLFTGCLGRNRVFFLVPSDIEDLHLPTDLLGITYISYSAADFKELGEVALGPASTQIARAVKERACKPLSALFAQDLTPRAIEEVFSLTAMTHAFPSREAAKPAMLRDISKADFSVRMYARVYLSELVKDVSGFTDSVREAIGVAKGDFLVRSTTTNNKDVALMQRLYSQEDPEGLVWTTLDEYTGHVRNAARRVGNLFRAVEKGLEASGSEEKVRFELREIDDVLPHSLLIIDERVVYVSFYRLSSTAHGTHAPTLRLVNEEGRADWADIFLRDARHIDEQLARAQEGM